ncbi:MGMT family protein [Chitinophaga caeni]|nr:MGMT family protein [Chitinophaga caeni]
MKMFPSPKKQSSSTTGKSKDKTSFFEAVFEVARKIPKGRVSTYGAIAEATGLRITPRMVGWAMHAAGSAKPKVPAHRVVNRLGELSGKDHFEQPGLMQALLEAEGLTVKDGKIQQFKKFYWDPNEHK